MVSYGDAYLSGYMLYHNGKPSGGVSTPDVLQATISDLEPGLNIIYIWYLFFDSSQPLSQVR